MEEAEADRTGPYLLKEEIEKAIQQLKNGKSEGIDGIPAEMIKAMSPKSVNALIIIIRFVVTSREPEFSLRTG